MLPFVQVEADFISSKAPRIAALAGIPQALALGHSVLLFAFIIPETSSEDTPPDGVLLDPDAATILESVVGWTGEPGRLFSAWVRAGLVEKLEIGARVRGLDRYAEAWRTAKSRSDKAKAAAESRWGKDVKPMPAPCPSNAQASPKHPPSRPQAHAPGCQDGDGDGDGDLLPSEVKKHVSPSAPAAVAAQPPLLSTQDLEPVEQLREAWNNLTSDPLPRWTDRSKLLRDRARAALKRRPLAEWRGVFERIEASPFLRGQGEGGWRADPEWALRPEGKKPEPAAQVLAGKYASGAATAPPLSERTAGRPPAPVGVCAVCAGAGDAQAPPKTAIRLCYAHLAAWTDSDAVRRAAKPWELTDEFEQWLQAQRAGMSAA